jgi:hypothetical protein
MVQIWIMVRYGIRGSSLVRRLRVLHFVIPYDGFNIVLKGIRHEVEKGNCFTYSLRIKLSNRERLFFKLLVSVYRFVVRIEPS